MNKTYRSRNYVSENFVKECRDCGAPISFAKNQTGKWLCVDVQTENAKSGLSFYWERSGANNNFINTHVCSGALYTRSILQACQTYQKINKCYVDLLFEAARSGNFDGLGRFQSVLKKVNERIDRRAKKINPKFITQSLLLQDALKSCGVKVDAL